MLGKAIWRLRIQENPSAAGAPPRTPLDGAYSAPANPLVGEEGLAVPSPRTASPALGPSSLASPTPHSKISCDAVGHWLRMDLMNGLKAGDMPRHPFLLRRNNIGQQRTILLENQLDILNINSCHLHTSVIQVNCNCNWNGKITVKYNYVNCNYNCNWKIKYNWNCIWNWKKWIS